MKYFSLFLMLVISLGASLPVESLFKFSDDELIVFDLENETEEEAKKNKSKNKKGKKGKKGTEVGFEVIAPEFAFLPITTRISKFVYANHFFWEHPLFLVMTPPPERA